jgi:RHS repeat-associated protein
LSYNYIYTYYYDGLSRLVAKRTDMNFNPSTPYWIYMEAFVYDGWNLVMSGKNGNGYASGPPANPITSSSRMHYVWGPDIGSGCSGHESWQAAGGVGGLIFVNGATDSVRQFPLLDRMGNVTGYRRAVSGSAAVLDAVFDYDAFGREVRSTGPASNSMPFRFSTKATDVDTGLVYYGYRFYDPDRGRWLNRDPLGDPSFSDVIANGLQISSQEGAGNLYAFLQNRVTAGVDAFGLTPTWLATCGIGACIGAIGGAIGGAAGAINNGSDAVLRGGLCGLFAGAATGCCATAFCTHFGPWGCRIASCVCAAIGNVIEQACTGTIGFNKCSLLSALGAGLTGCIGGQAALADNKKLDVIAFIIGVDASMMGSWCDNEE